MSAISARRHLGHQNIRKHPAMERVIDFFRAARVETLAALTKRAKSMLTLATSERRDCCLNAPLMRRTQPRLSCWHGPMIRQCSECAIRETSHPTLQWRATGTARLPV